MKLHILRIEQDFLWSIKMATSLRIYSYDRPYVYQGSFWSKCMQLWNLQPGEPRPACTLNCECGEQEWRYYRKQDLIIPCAPGQLVLGDPRTEGRSQFWTLNQDEVQRQIDNKKLIPNGIPYNWVELKRLANQVPAKDNISLQEEVKVKIGLGLLPEDLLIK